MKTNQFKKDLEIDLENLEVEAAMQPSIFFKYVNSARKAKQKLDQAKIHYEVVQAELCHRARINPASFGIIKVTDKAVNDAVINKSKYQEAYKAFLKAKTNADFMHAAVNAFEQRKRMIEIEVSLFGKEYFSGPAIPHTPEVFWKNLKKKQGEKLDAKMKERAKNRKRKNK